MEFPERSNLKLTTFISSRFVNTEWLQMIKIAVRLQWKRFTRAPVTSKLQMNPRNSRLKLQVKLRIFLETYFFQLRAAAL